MGQWQPKLSVFFLEYRLRFFQLIHPPPKKKNIPIFVTKLTTQAQVTRNGR